MTDEEFRAVFEQHQNAVYQFAWRMTNSPAAAEDIAQEVFLSVWRGEAEIDRSRGSWRSLLLGIARNMAWKRWRREQKWASLEEDAACDVALRVESLGVQEAVGEAMQALPPLQREALILATYSGLTLEEIADTAGVEIGTIKSRLHRARENLKRMLAAYRPGEANRRRGYGTAR